MPRDRDKHQAFSEHGNDFSLSMTGARRILDLQVELCSLEFIKLYFMLCLPKLTRK
jgi:hypothetical protein